MTDNTGEKEYKVASKRKTSTGTKVLVVVILLVGIGIVGFPYLQQANLIPAIETSQSEEFQDPEDGGNFGRIEPVDTPREEPIRTPQFDPGPIEDELEAQRRALEEQNAELAADVAALQAQLSNLANAEPTEDNSAELAEALQEMQTQNTRLLTQMQEEMDNRLAQAELETERRLAAEQAAREEAEAEAAARDAAAEEMARQARVQQQQLTELITQLQRENQALSDQMQTGMNEALREQAERDRLAAEQAARRAALEAQQAEAAALREAQIRSEGVVFDAGGQQTSPAAGGQEGVPAGAANPAGTQAPLSGDAAARQFVLDGAPSVTVTTSEVIANPSRTVLQGTIIQASLETAIDSSLPGQITAIVNRPVWSFDQSRMLIPQGSRLFGTYDSDVSLGQQRVLIGWTRLVTPDGQSVQLSAFGADDQGRSGATGDVNNRFGLRFGSAALLSIIGAGPALAAASQDSEIGAETAERIGENFAQTTNAVIGEYATIPPIISVQPGAAVSVIVDRDLEFY